ncbi:TadE/TadG family type IV pilus assembly protein [Collinsella provencensis]|uniref:TadE/TadG family type IV pilus assembly protein n=1 Tax=Collinsella provencensis TaxID=1937461 RepID=UPI002278892C|nr:TadE/TadG family type IV pilus assembly protein [Collinsella provencensis]
MRRERLTSHCIDALTENDAQATIEAAFLLPTFLLLMLLALQPVCMLYTRAVMESTAAETARLMVTAEGDEDEPYRDFALRRLTAIPNVSIFHAGGWRSWDIELVRSSDTGGAVSVSIEGFVRPLPVLGAFAGAFGETNGQGDVRMRAEVAYEGRPAWLEEGYESWIAQWG